MFSMYSAPAFSDLNKKNEIDMYVDSVDFDGCIVNSDFHKNVPGPKGFLVELEPTEPKDYTLFAPMTYVIYPDKQNNPEKILYTYVDKNKKTIGPRSLSELQVEANKDKWDSIVRHFKNRLSSKELEQYKLVIEADIKYLDSLLDDEKLHKNKSRLENDLARLRSALDDSAKFNKESLHFNEKFPLIDMKSILTNINAPHHGDFRSERDKQNRLMEDVVFYNKNWVNYIAKKNRNSQSVMMIGSNRQYRDVDSNNCNKNQTYSSFFLLQKLAGKINSVFDPMLMGDIANGLHYGDTLREGKNINYDKYDWKQFKDEKVIKDEAKIALLYAQMHKLAAENPGKFISYTFYDDRDDILNLLKELYSAMPELIPHNVKLTLCRYNGAPVEEVAHIMGKGNIDRNLREVLQLMAPKIENISELMNEKFPHGSKQTLKQFGEDLFKTASLFSLNKAVSELGRYAQHLAGMGETVKAANIHKFTQDINQEIEEFRFNKDTIPQFQKTISVKLHDENINKLMSGHRKAWKPIMANIALALTGIGLLAVIGRFAYVKGGFAGKNSSAFFFGQTHRQELQEKMVESVNQLRM